MVILEAMVSGIPVITTDQTAGPEIIEDGIDGWTITAGDVEALQNRLTMALEERDRLPEMGREARRKAEMRSWERYRSELRANISRALCLPFN